MATVSIIIPVYNKETVIEKSIESVLNQTFKDFELIIINDGSTDSSEEIILAYKEKDSRIIYVKQTNKGVAVARNIGIKKSKAKYISFLDADDEMDPLFLKKMLTTIGNANVCYCGHYDVWGHENKKAKFKFVENDILAEYFFNKCTPNTNSWLIKKEYLDQFKIRFSSDINWGEDMEFFSKVLLHDINIKCVSEFLTYYHKDQLNSLSEGGLEKICKDIFWMNRITEYIDNHEPNTGRKVKVIRAIQSYRLPAAIIYRINSNRNKVSQDILKTKMYELKYYLYEMKISNGLRSIKLYYIYFKLKLKFRFK